MDKKSIEDKKNEEKDKPEKKSFHWVETVFGALTYILSKYLIFGGHHSLLTGILSFMVGAGFGMLLVSLIRK